MIGITFDGLKMTGDLERGAQGLAQDNGLTTCVLVSLFTDRRAQVDDPLPAGNGEYRRGWVGDALSEIDGDRIGSRLWLLHREKQTEETRRRAEEYCREALAWLVTDGLATQVEVTAEWVSLGVLGALIVITQPDGSLARLSIEVLRETV